jgi:predicted GIY-YIG superfamily endonuclease
MFYTYVLQSMKDGKFYTGYTFDLPRWNTAFCCYDTNLYDFSG